MFRGFKCAVRGCDHRAVNGAMFGCDGCAALVMHFAGDVCAAHGSDDRAAMVVSVVR